MPVLKRHLYEELNEASKNYLIDQDLVNSDGSDIDLGQDHNHIKQLIRNEKDNVGAYDTKYQKEKNKAKYIILFLGAAVALLGAGFALAPFFIVTTIVLPILPVLLIGFAIIGITKLFLNMKVNHLEASVTQASNVLGQLKDIDMNAGREMVGFLKDEIQNTTTEVLNRIGKLEEQATQNNSQLLAKLGTFSTAAIPIPIAHTDPANDDRDRERTAGPTHT